MRRIFRAPHGLLLLATLLCLALLFAPITYANNFTTNVYVTLFGTWAKVENTLSDAPGNIITYTCFEDPIHLLYAALTAANLIFLLYTLFLGGHDERRARLCALGVLLVFCQMGASLLLLFHAPSFVGTALPGDIERGFNREWAFHLFMLFFLVSARRRYRQALGRRLEKAGRSDKIDTAGA